MHLGELLTHFLMQCGTTHVFGVPGAQTCALFDGILKCDPAIRHIVMRDECNTAFAADAYARLTHKVGVCDVTVGPGCARLPPSLTEAYYSSIPLLCIISDLPQAWRHLYERGAALQAMEQERLVGQASKSVMTLTSPEQLPTTLETLLRRAVSGRPGPVALIVPQDVFESRVSAEAQGHKLDPRLGRFPLSRPAPDPREVARAAQLLLQAKCPVIAAGGGIHLAEATAEIKELAELLTMPVVTTFSGRGAIQDSHPSALGLVGNIGTSCAREALEAADVVFLVGFKSGQNSTLTWKLPRAHQTIIHLDLDPAEIGKVFPTKVGLIGDARLGLRALIDALKAARGQSGAAPNEERLKWIRGLRASWQQEAGEALTSDALPIKPQRVMQEINKLTKPDDILVCDASYVTGWGMLFYHVARAGKVILAPRGFAGLGFGIPAAIGAASARPESRIIALCGDHGISYSLGELATAAHYGMNIKVIVFNNEGSRWIDHYHRLSFEGSGEPFRWGSTDFATVGQGLGCLGIRVEKPQKIAGALGEALSSKGPAVVDVMVSGEETPVADYQKAFAEKRKTKSP